MTPKQTSPKVSSLAARYHRQSVDQIITAMTPEVVGLGGEVVVIDLAALRKFVRAVKKFTGTALAQDETPGNRL